MKRHCFISYKMVVFARYPKHSNLDIQNPIMPSHVNGYPIDSVNSANMLHARVTVNPLPAAPKMKIMNGIMV